MLLLQLFYMISFVFPFPEPRSRSHPPNDCHHRAGLHLLLDPQCRHVAVVSSLDIFCPQHKHSRSKKILFDQGYNIFTQKGSPRQLIAIFCDPFPTVEICKYYVKVNLCANKFKLCTLLVGCGEFMRRWYKKN